MKKRNFLAVVLFVILLVCTGCSEKQPELLQFQEPQKDQPIATMQIKDYGAVKIMLFPEQAPKAVKNFITHAQEGYYNGLKFHRVIVDFMIQGGDPRGDGTGGKSIWNSPFEDEFSENLFNVRGALSMANSGANTNQSQFFIVTGQQTIDETYMKTVETYNKKNGSGVQSFPDNVIEKYVENGGSPHLDGVHTVFGQVIEGMDIIDAISSVPTDENDRPITPVIVETITISNYQ